MQELLARLGRLFEIEVETLAGVEERVQFRLPEELVNVPAAE